jgi:hypothetical protein
MIDYAFYLASGEYIQTGATMEPITEGDIPDGCGVYYGAVNTAEQYHSITSDSPVDMPAKPGVNYKFDFVTYTWVEDLTQVRTAVLARRQQLLADSDWTDTVSAQTRLGATYATWQLYRQALRDITSQAGYPITIEWPTAP